jgi:hypothetical protein
MYRNLSFLVLAGWVVGCGPAAVSETISVKLGGIKEGDVRDGAASKHKSVNEESGNPYHEFLTAARRELDGADPSAIVPTDVTLRLRGDSDGVTSFHQVFATIEVYLEDERTTIPIGSTSDLEGSSVEVPVDVNADDLEPLHHSLLTDGIKVGLRGMTVATPPASFELKATIDIVFEAIP